LLALIPLGWCVVGGGTLLAMESPEAYLVWAAAAVAILCISFSCSNPSMADQ
jgi:hypothetical protein